MEYVTIEIQNGKGEFLVEAINYGPPDGDGDGEIYTTRFMGPEAGIRAREYAAFKNDPVVLTSSETSDR